MATSHAPRTRDAERSREAILNAAEQLFARNGYRGTSLQDIGDAAGVSRGTPSYFFGSKEGVYRAVMERTLSGVVEVVRRIRAEAVARGEGPEEVFAREIEGYIDFLVARPTFVRLIQWEAVTGGEVLGDFAPHLSVLTASLAAVSEEVERGSFRPVDPLHLLVSIVAMCWFPLAQQQTMMRALGTNPFDPAFVAEHKRHVVDLVLNGIRQR